MKKHLAQELPIRSKIEMLKDISIIIHSLHHGTRSVGNEALEDLKSRSLFFDTTIQQDVLNFAEQIAFQYDYDPWHLVTEPIKTAADKLIEDLGFQKPA